MAKIPADMIDNAMNPDKVASWTSYANPAEDNEMDHIDYNGRGDGFRTRSDYFRTRSEAPPLEVGLTNATNRKPPLYGVPEGYVECGNYHTLDLGNGMNAEGQPLEIMRTTKTRFMLANTLGLVSEQENQFDYQYNHWLGRTLEEGERRDDRTKTGTISMFGDVNMKFDLRQDFPAITGKRLAFKTMKIETIDWMLEGRYDLKTLKDLGVKIWDQNVKEGTEVYEKIWNEDRIKMLSEKQREHFNEFRTELLAQRPARDSLEIEAALSNKLNNWGIPDQKLVDGYLGPIYGKQWRAWEDIRIIPAQEIYDATAWTNYGARGFDYTGLESSSRITIRREVDQIALIEEAIKNEVRFHKGEIPKHSAGRRIILTGWNVGQLDEMQLPPCHTLAQWYVSSNTDENGKHYLDCKLYQRSSDLFLGLPFNVAQYAMMTEMFAYAHGLTARHFHVTIGDAHIYANHVDQVKEQLKRPIVHKAPKLQIDPSAEKGSILNIRTHHIDLVGYTSYDSITAPIAGN